MARKLIPINHALNVSGFFAIIGGTANVPLYRGAKLDTNSGGVTAATNSDIPRVLECTTSTDLTYQGIIYPVDQDEVYLYNATDDNWYAQPGQKVFIMGEGSRCQVEIKAGATINPTTAGWKTLLSCGDGGFVATPTTASEVDVVACELSNLNTGYAGNSKHMPFVTVRKFVVANPAA